LLTFLEERSPKVVRNNVERNTPEDPPGEIANLESAHGITEDGKREVIPETELLAKESLSSSEILDGRNRRLLFDEGMRDIRSPKKARHEICF
jgi:hypothetical protein